MTPTDALIEKMARDDYARLQQFSAQVQESVRSAQRVLGDVIDRMIARAAYSAEHEEDGK